MRRLSAAAVALAFFPFFAPAGASADPVLIAVLDTGIDASHVEFGAGQVVAWKDFVDGRPDPYDDHGHGTMTASLAAGNNRGSCGAAPKLSYAPGVGLIVAKVGDENGAFSHVGEAIAWASAQGADVISMSFGFAAPMPSDTTRQVEDAIADGAIVVVSAGNGLLNLGTAPFPSWSRPYSNEVGALVVGSGTRTGTLSSTTGNLDPDVTSWGDRVCVARPGGGYGVATGTSFSTPLVAGMVANAIAAARAAGTPDDVATIYDIVLYSASNNAFSPYAREGMGHMLDAEAARAAAHAAAGTPRDTLVAAYDAQGAHATADRAYHDTLHQTAQQRNLR